MGAPVKSPHDVILAWLDAFNMHDAAAAARLYHPDAVNHQVAAGDPAVGRDAIYEGLKGFFTAFPDSFTHLESLLIDDNRAAIEWSGGGTWQGAFAGREPTGQAFTLRGCGFFIIEDGLIKFQRGYWDRITWFEQIGLPVNTIAG
jgi:steroid delta-isomerase-like uncharacterized protein